MIVLDWDDLRYLAAFARHGSLSASAKLLGVEHATVARRIADLERTLDVKLLDRRGRHLVLTPTGQRIAEILLRVSDEFKSIERIAQNDRATLRGTITISAPPAYAARVLAPRIVEFSSSHPELIVRLLGETREASLDNREADVAIRLSRPDTGDLTIRKIDRIKFNLYASKSYLKSIAEADRRYIGSVGPMAKSSQQRAILDMVAESTIMLESNEIEIQAAMAVAGGGIAILPTFVASGRTELEIVRTERLLPERDVWMVVHTDMRTSTSIAALTDHLSGSAR